VLDRGVTRTAVVKAIYGATGICSYGLTLKDPECSVLTIGRRVWAVGDGLTKYEE